MGCHLQLHQAAALLLLAVLLLHTRAQPLPELGIYATELAEQRLFAGMVHVDQGGSTVFSKGFGQANWELEVPMKNDHRYPIGSNTKLFTAVAVWQLHRAGKLSVYDPVSKYLNRTELGLTGPWCPRVHNTSQTGPCQSPQIQQLLQMSSGVLGFDNCNYKPDAWQQQYCWGEPKFNAVSNFSFGDFMDTQAGGLSITDYLTHFGILKMPLEFVPGSHYHYSNPGYTIAGYIIEQVSGMSIADYYRINIFQKYGLSSTLYDTSNGILGLHKAQLPYPAYISYLMPGTLQQVEGSSGVAVQVYDASAGNPAYWGGDVHSNNTSLLQSTLSASDGTSAAPSSGAVYQAFIAKYPGPSNLDWVEANAAGAISSTPQDMAKWFRALLVDPEHLGLGKDLLQEFLNLSIREPGIVPYKNAAGGNVTLEYAQGILVVKAPKHPRGLGVSHVYYLGSLGGFQAVAYMSLDPADPKKDVFVNSVAATVLPDQSNWPPAAQQLTEQQCAQQSSSPAAAGTASNSSSGGNNGNSSTSMVASPATGRHRRLFQLPLPGANPSAPPLAVRSATAAASQPSVQGVLCELTHMVPSYIKTVPDLLARKAVRELTGQEWFGITQ